MSSGIMETWLFDSLLVTTMLMGTILLIRRPVAKLFGAGVAYALWLIPAARLMMPSLERTEVPVSDSGLSISDAVRDTVLGGGSSPQVVVDTASKSIVAAVDLTALGVTFWLGGAALFFIIQMIRYASMRDDLLSEATEIAKIDGVRVVASDQVAGPLAFGLFKRYIAVPQDFTKSYSPAERELAIAHEMAHHRSGDLFANLAAFTILCLQWFNPVAWMSWNAFRFDQEAACDARVLAGKCAEQRAIYGQALAKTAFDGVPTFATALNSPKTIIERLRRLTMKDASAQRRWVGKLGILTVAAIVLPLTATIVPAVRADESVELAKPDKKTVKVVKISMGTVVDGKPTGSVVKTVMRDGKTFIFHSDRELSEEQVEKLIDEAQQSREEADDAIVLAEEARGDAEAALGEAEAARGEAEAARGEAEAVWGEAAAAQATAVAARGHAEAMRVHAVAMAANYIPEIDISEITENCRAGQPVATDVHGFDGTGKSRIKIVMCGKGQAKLARAEALNGLREARSEIGNEKDLPDHIRKDVLKKLEQQIRRLEARLD